MSPETHLAEEWSRINAKCRGVELLEYRFEPPISSPPRALLTLKKYPTECIRNIGDTWNLPWVTIVVHEFTSGGISTGAQITALLTMGADGVVLGTCFLFTPECEYSAAKKDALLKADLGATVRTMAFDEVGQTNGWPPICDGRGMSNKITDDYNAGLSIEERVEKFAESARTGDTS
ncbi:hypothetical protein B0H11DRAFT_2240975 [Mycena galericulata]|nr:hypothetical protein B0H11DRAFT_2240975 [Mycena galericulata]